MRAVNLIPSDQRRGGSVGAGRSGGAAYAVLALVGGLALMALLYGIAHHQVGSRQSEAVEYTAKAQQAQAQASQLGAYTSFIAMRQARTQAVEQLVDSRFDWAHTFHELGRVLPRDASISTLTGTVGSTEPGAGAKGSAGSASAAAGSGAKGSAGGSVSSATPPGTIPVFTITGCATSQSAVAETINRLRLIDGVASVALQSSTKTASSGGVTASSSGAGSCPANSPQYNLLVTFQGLPSGSGAQASPASASSSGANG